MRIPRALTIAGSDSCGGAGIQADLKTFAALGVYGMTAVTAITAQNTVEVSAIREIDPDVVSAQIHAVSRDIGIDAVKTGMLVSKIIIDQVAKDIRSLRLEKVVVDPVMVAGTGARLLREDAIDALTHELFPLAEVVTPNLREAAVLVGFDVNNVDAMKEAAVVLKRLGPTYVLIKGGHLIGDPLDLLYDGSTFRTFYETRRFTRHTHGTGCTFAAAITAGLAKGLDMESAVDMAKKYVTGAIQEGLAIGKGSGPVHHFHELYRLANIEFDNR